MFEYYENTLCIQAKWLHEVGVISMSNLKFLTHTKKVKKARSGRGLGNCALYVYESLPQRFRNIIEHDMGIDPYAESKVIKLAKYLKYDEEACVFFSNYELEDGRFLSEVNTKAVNEYTANVSVLKAIKKVLNKVTSANPKIKKGELWKRVTTSVHKISDELKKRYPFDLPKNPTALRARYEACILEKPNDRYPRAGLEGIIHNNYCNKNSEKRTSEINDWLLSMYCLPVKYSVYQLWCKYEEEKVKHGWPTLSESTITNYLEQPETKRIWYLQREGEEEYNKKYAHSLSKDKNRLFPNAHWAIDGTKFDAVHYWDNKNKMAAICKINVVIDVYSEKIIGYSFSFTENHVDHFIALRMAVDNAGARPYLFTYDAQSAHRSKRMQELYSKVIAKKGQHYHHKVGRKSNPIEQVFHRLQSEVITKRWFSDGQGIKSKQNISKRDLKIIEKHKGALPTVDELMKHWELMVAEWNNSKRTKKAKKTRNEYFLEKSKHTQELSVLDRISMFWLNESKAKTYYAHGMPLTVAGEDYLYEVYDADGEVDIDFHVKYVQTKFIVSYDPEFLDDYVALYRINEKGEKVFAAYAQKKRTTVEVNILKKEGEHAQMLRDLEVRSKVKARDEQAYQELIGRSGISFETLIEEQNSWVDNNYEFNAKRQAYATKEEQLETDNDSVFANITH